ncbi:LytR/AlgR family response regulator transcription factor [Fluviicola taffensis]|uniref:Two component transcriptional regulator, LytTR family n=1 Tax=Fluviicola taffensis (strain DSM 16823 / NCIMB 13979 / RW262) TaxID=755732 RepID=F2IAE5_FLUTR|nr:LytTR family DNA-binding domain-containing protein [Fluviicola taffensis]AEA42080.1 two component transcriptional regulator, LytTR family [Fluviicola taffensis DSM 16823]
MKLRAIIVDDERHSLETTALLIRKFCPDVEVIAELQSPIDAVEIINKEEPHLLFLDISMPKMNGFELLNVLTYKDADVVFTTAYDEYALEGFKQGAVHYLVKPIDAEDLVESVQRVKKKLSEAKASGINGMGLKPKIPISSLNGVELIEVDQIIRCESDGNYTTIVLHQRKITVSKTLKEIERQLIDFPFFFRLHNSHLVNLNQVVKYIRGEGGSVILTNQEEIGVSRSKKMELLEVLGIN